MLSETLYHLRRKSGLSQEQLAEKIGVSRQAISKWEGGLSTPELDKLIALSKVFDITVDALVGGESEHTVVNTSGENTSSRDKSDNHSKSKVKFGIGLCLAGAVFLILFGLITMLSPSSAEQISQSSAITLNGTGIALLLCIICMVTGVVLIIKNKWR